MTIHVKLWYETLDGQEIETPDNYPDTIPIRGIRPRNITDDLVTSLLLLHLREHGATHHNIVFYWNAMNDEVKSLTIN